MGMNFCHLLYLIVLFYFVCFLLTEIEPLGLHLYKIRPFLSLENDFFATGVLFVKFCKTVGKISKQTCTIK